MITSCCFILRNISTDIFKRPPARKKLLKKDIGIKNRVSIIMLIFYDKTVREIYSMAYSCRRLPVTVLDI